jgi:cobalt-zinc-cadmium efflux system membrane fusion protein
MFVSVNILTRTLDSVIAVPDEAVQRLGDRDIVFVMTDAHTFSAREVKTAPAQNGVVQILEGLLDSERAVTRGSFLLKSELLKGMYGE